MLFFAELSLYSVSNDWANRELRENNNRLLNLNILNINFKILLIFFKVIHGLAPKYLSELWTCKTKCNYNLRSTSEILLQQPRIKTLRTLGDRSFTVAAPALWNNLPNVIRSTTSINSFKKLLKTHLFKIAFNL